MMVFRSRGKIFPLHPSNASNTGPSIDMMEKKAEVSDQAIFYHSSNARCRSYSTQKAAFAALDPAGLLFRYSDRKVQVDDTDAMFVDVIHTNPAPVSLLGNCPYNIETFTLFTVMTV
ncbi:hypothetical protein AVEN_189881-1 [Araneus ventricosus]|uniref:Lipase domain-containing protein n=1 Tax=Araneus ventricosus TaxID=182803 RepID=A0A4Y2ED92_ARAVE|nr:hypothetical protein AVEN_189881-1 [Araneus ventricosus]